MPTSEQLDAAVRALRIEAGPTMDPMRLMGARHARARARIMSALCGHRVPQSAAGVYALRAAFLDAFNLADAGTCGADRADILAAALDRYSRDLGHRDGARAMSEEMCGG